MKHLRKFNEDMVDNFLENEGSINDILNIAIDAGAFVKISHEFLGIPISRNTTILISRYPCNDSINYFSRFYGDLDIERINKIVPFMESNEFSKICVELYNRLSESDIFDSIENSIKYVNDVISDDDGITSKFTDYGRIGNTYIKNIINYTFICK